MGFIADIARKVEGHGIRVVFIKGSATRGNGQRWKYGNDAEGLIDHHTAGAYKEWVDELLIDAAWRGWPGAPLCNYSIGSTGILFVVAENPANVNGASGGWDTEPMTTTLAFNTVAAGVEMQYPGNKPMTDAQWKTLAVLNHEAMERMGHPGDYRWIKNHNGTSVTGKWDMGYAPGKTIDISEVRRAAQAVGNSGVPTPSKPSIQEDEVTNDDIVKIVNGVLNADVGGVRLRDRIIGSDMGTNSTGWAPRRTEEAHYQQLRKDLGYVRSTLSGQIEGTQDALLTSVEALAKTGTAGVDADAVVNEVREKISSLRVEVSATLPDADAVDTEQVQA